MKKSWNLEQVVQCDTCPWRKGAKLKDIPNYNRGLHEGLSSTIAEPEVFSQSGSLSAMACHYSTEQKDYYCIGWLWNQLTVGNSISLRLQVASCKNIKELTLKGEQRNNLQETLDEVD